VQTLASSVEPSSRHWSLIPTGLFLARVALEATRRPWPGFLVVTVGLLAALAGFALACRLAPRPRLFVICHLSFVIYILWPQRDPLAAASVALLAALVWLLSEERISLPRWSGRGAMTAPLLADGATFAVALTVYVATAAPDVLPADAGEFQMVAALLGVAHPPGFPLYTMMGHLFIRLLPWGTPAYRLNLMSGLLAAGTLVLLARATRLWARRLGASLLATVASGLAAALTLGTATTFWAQATIANVRTLAVFFAALALCALARFAASEEPGKADRHLILLALALGLGGGHYPPLAFVSLFFVIYVLLTDLRLAVQPRRWWRPLLVGLVAFLLPLAYLPIRDVMGAPQAPGNLDTLPGFLHHFLARGFGGDMFAFANTTDLPHRLALLPTLFPFQFNTVLLVAALLGLLGLIRRDWRLFVLLAGSLVLQTFIAITYRAPQTVEYLMPAYLPIAIAVGLLPSLLSTLSSLLSPLLCSIALWAALLNGWTHAPSFIELAGDHTARQAVEPLLEHASAEALILTDWRWFTPLRYLQRVEGLRPDIEVNYVFNVPREEYRETWLRRIQEADPKRPLLLTHCYGFSDYATEPWEAGFLIRPRPVTEPAAPLTPVSETFGDKVHILGYSIWQDQFQLGQVIEFTLAWQPTEPLDLAPSFTLRLASQDGRDRVQTDRWLGTDCNPGEVCFARLAVPLYPTLNPGRYRVTIGVYTVTGGGFESLPAAGGEYAVTLTWLELESPTHAPFTLHRQSVPFSAGPTLVGVDYDRSVPNALRVYLRWQGPAEGSPSRSGEGPGEGSLQAWVRSADGVVAGASLPSLPAGAYQTIAVDLRGSVGGPLHLALVGDGQVRTAAGPWGWSVQEVRLPTSAPDARFVPLGDEMALVGVTAKRPLRLPPAAPGETMAVDVTLVALRPLTTDDHTSVRLMGADGHWLDSHDSQPALGAVPTLKWIRGSRVVDRHLLSVPEDFTGGEVWATLVAYEGFRMTDLVPMDGRFVQVPLGTWEAP